MSLYATKEQVAQAECPKCGARAGEACVDPTKRERKSNHVDRVKAWKRDNPDLLWEAVYEEWTGQSYVRGEPLALTRAEVGRLHGAVDQLRAVDATPEQVHERAAEYRRRWSVDFTPTALVANWTTMGRPQSLAPIVDAPRSEPRMYQSLRDLDDGGFFDGPQGES